MCLVWFQGLLCRCLVQVRVLQMLFQSDCRQMLVSLMFSCVGSLLCFIVWWICWRLKCCFCFLSSLWWCSSGLFLLLCLYLRQRIFSICCIELGLQYWWRKFMLVCRRIFSVGILVFLLGILIWLKVWLYIVRQILILFLQWLQIVL